MLNLCTGGSRRRRSLHGSGFPPLGPHLPAAFAASRSSFRLYPTTFASNIPSRIDTAPTPGNQRSSQAGAPNAPPRGSAAFAVHVIVTLNSLLYNQGIVLTIRHYFREEIPTRTPITAYLPSIISAFERAIGASSNLIPSRKREQVPPTKNTIIRL